MSGRVILLEADLHAFVDGQLSKREAEQVRLHLTRDADAAARAARWREQAEALQAKLASVAEEPLPLRLRLTRIAPPQPSRGGDRTRLQFALGVMMGFAIGAAAVGALLMVVK